MNIAPNGMIRLTALAFIGILGFAGPRSSAGQTPSPANAQSEAGEPRATTSAEAPPTPEQTPGALPGAPSGASAGSPPGYPPGSPSATPADLARGAQRSAAKTGDVHGKAQAAGKSAATDKLQLQTATVTGDQEQPKVMYIVPWKKSDIGDLSGKPMNSLLDEALAPVDRDEFKREVMYYQAVRADASHNGAGAGAAAVPAPPR